MNARIENEPLPSVDSSSVDIVTPEILPGISNYSKFQVVVEPLQQIPHKCAGCFRYTNNNPDDPLKFITWNLDVEFYGVVFVCVDCIREILNQLGGANAKQVRDFKEVLHNQAGVIHELSDENMRLRNALGNLELVTPAVPSVTRVWMDDPTDGDKSTGGESRADDSTSDILEEFTGRKDGVAKPAHESRLSDLLDDESAKLFPDD